MAESTSSSNGEEAEPSEKPELRLSKRQRLSRLFEDIDTDLIERMADEERKRILKEVAVGQPAIIIDVAAKLKQREEAEPPRQPEDDNGPPAWCVCRRCPHMTRDMDKLYCGMAPQYCNSIIPEMGLIVTDELTLYIQQTFRNYIFAQQAETVEDTNRAFRHAAYRQYILWLYGRLQKDDRRTVPACCVQVIRNKFPSLFGRYTGFIPS